MGRRLLLCQNIERKFRGRIGHALFFSIVSSIKITFYIHVGVNS